MCIRPDEGKSLKSATDTDSMNTGVIDMHNFKLTAQQRTALLTDMRAKMKQQPHILGLEFKLHLASKAEIIEAAEKLGLDAASYGTPAGGNCPASSKPKPLVF